MNKFKKEILAIIPARGGSKSIKNKNIVNLFGKPLIYHSIKSAKKCPYISRTIVSTDSNKIKRIALKYGAEAPFIRPRKLAHDNSKDFDVFYHCLKWLLKNESYKPDLIIHLRPTYPMRNASEIKKSIEFALSKKNFDSIRSVCEPMQHPFKMYVLNKKNFLKPFAGNSKKEFGNWPRQKLPKIYWHNGYLDIVNYNTIMKLRSMSGKKILPYFLKNDEIHDVDDKISLEIIKKLFSN